MLCLIKREQTHICAVSDSRINSIEVTAEKNILSIC
jgi:hypothetical protein